MVETAECGAIPPNVGGPIPCHLEPGHDGEHFSTSGCAGSEIRWRDATETAAPAVEGIEQASAPCFTPLDANGYGFERGDGVPHWATASEGHREVFKIRREYDGDPPIIRLSREEAPCWHLTCAECGYRFDEDEWVSHFLDRAEAEQTAEDCDWHVLDGRLLCPECYLTELRTPPEERP